MTQYLRGLIAEIANAEVDPTLEPQEEVGPDDIVVGEMSDDLKRMGSLYAKTCEKDVEVQRRAAGIMIAVSMQEKSVEEGKTELCLLMEEKVELDEEANAIRVNFQRSLKTEFPALRGKTNIVFRRGWKIVLTNASTETEACPDYGKIHESTEENSMEMPGAQSEEPDGSNFFGLNLN